MKLFLISILMVFALVACSTASKPYTMQSWTNDCGLNTLKQMATNSNKLGTDLQQQNYDSAVVDASIDTAPWLACATKIPDGLARGYLQAAISNLEQSHQNLVIGINNVDPGEIDIATSQIESATSDLQLFTNRVNELR